MDMQSVLHLDCQAKLLRRHPSCSSSASSANSPVRHGACIVQAGIGMVL